MTEVPNRRPPGTPCWVSLMAHRADLARSFYGALFGWEFVPGPPQLGTYALAELDGRRIAGIGEGAPEPHRPVAWTTMLASDDVDETAELVRECGGTVGIGPLQVNDEGRLALAVDPSGAVFGVWQGGLLGGAEATGEPGTLAWSELVTRDASLVGKFYEAVFGLEAEDAASDSDDVLLRVGGHPVAAIHGVGSRVPRDRGAHWTTHFAVADVDDAAARVTALGGHVIHPAHPSPHGRTATLTDPEGAPFTLQSPP
ncbi:VOC family protein [Streptomyces sp. NPDC088197]|uniref:VOC family protein n=1 Tax=unclassified Streptomyces TaxID=2593676 RepID=UPI0036EFD539